MAEHVELSDDFESELESVVGDAYSVLVERLKVAHFAEWHRRRGLEDDLAQETAAMFLTHCTRNRKLPKDAVAYMVTIARNLANQHYKRVMLAQTVPIPANIIADLNESIDGLLLGVEPSLAQMALVETTVLELPQRQREAITVFLANPGDTHRELALRMGISETAYQKNLSRAIDRIRQAIETTDSQ